jgi:hypothetical protein
LAKLVELQGSLADQPYSISLRLKLAATYRNLGYPDLAAGDAYKALLLVDEVLEEGEYHEKALNSANSDASSLKALVSESGLSLEPLRLDLGAPVSHAQIQDGENGAVAFAKGFWPETAYDYTIIVSQYR